MQHSPELFECEACPVLAQTRGLWPENQTAWQVFTAMSTRFVVDVGLGSEVFRREAAALDAEAQADLVDRLGVIYDIVCPPQTPKGAD